MSVTEWLTLSPGTSAPVDAIPCLAPALFRRAVLRLVADGRRILAFFGIPGGTSTRLVIALADNRAGVFRLACADVGASYPALTPDCPAAHWFEREIAEQCAVVPAGHPWLKPIRYQRADVPGRDAWGRSPDEEIRPAVADFFRLEGEEAHEVAVGPVHAGIIEPGHFRFQCHGEEVFHLEIALGYQHRGVEALLRAGPNARTGIVAETLAGDTSIGHGLAYCEILESLAGTTVPPRALALRALALELERLANHTGDLGALANDVGFLPTAAYCGRLRGDFLNLTALACGNRFGRGWLRPGGVAFDLDTEERRREMRTRLAATARDAEGAARLLWETPSVMARFEETGAVSRETAEALGLVGVAARACGLERDARFEFPGGFYAFAQIPVATWHTGDVFARAYVRFLEIQHAVAFLDARLEALPEGPLAQPLGTLAPRSIAVALTEGWRGEICHVALTDATGRFAAYKVVDPSFHNWMGLALALRGQQISDFPLCNKSFNLSYCGHDL